MPDLKSGGVWFIATRTHTGSDQYTLTLADELARLGVRTLIDWLPLQAEYLPWSVRKIKAPAWASVVHVNSWLPNRFIPAGLPIVTCIHHCVHDKAFTPYKSVGQRLYHKYWIAAVERNALNRASAVVAPSEFTARATQQAFGLGGIKVIPNGIRIGDFHIEPRTRPHVPFRLLFVGSQSRRKGFDLLPELMRLLGDRFEIWHSGTESRSDKCKISHATALGNQIPFRRIQEAYLACDALIFPSHLEGFGLAALEAQACGLPVIASNSSAIPEVVQDGKTGILCESGDVRSLAAAARLLAADCKLWRRLSANARKNAENFCISRTAAAYCALYTAAISRSLQSPVAHPSPIKPARSKSKSK